MRLHVLSCTKLCFALALAVALSSKTIQAAWPKAQTDDQRAARLVEQALESEVKGDSYERSRLLKEAIRISPDFAPARWQLGQVHYATKWRSLYEIEKIFSEKKQLAEYRRLRKRARPNAQSHIALANWCLKNSLEDEHRVHLLMALRFKPGDKRIIQRLLQNNGRSMSKTELALLEERGKKALEKSKKWYQDISKLRHPLIKGTQSQRFEALRQLRSISDPAAIPALEATFLTLTPTTSFEERELSQDLIQVIGKMPQYEATLALIRQAVYSSSPIIRSTSIDQLKNRPLHEYVPLLIAGMTSPVKTKVQIVGNPISGITYRHTFYREGLKHDMQVVRQKRYVPVPGKPLKRSKADLQLIQKKILEKKRQKDLEPIRQKNLVKTHQRIVQSLKAARSTPGAAPEGLIHLRTLRRKLAYENREYKKVGKIAAKEDNNMRLEIQKRGANARRSATQEAISVENAVKKENFKVYRSNQPYRSVLAETVGVDYGIEPGNWWRWWKNYNELYVSSKNPVYTKYFTDSVRYSIPSSVLRSAEERSAAIPPTTVMKSLIPGTTRMRAELFLPPTGRGYIYTHEDGTYAIEYFRSCFIAGTKVWTKTGPVDIESILRGDRVLSQDPDTGELAYKLVLVTTVRPPDQLVKIGMENSSIEDNSITVTRGHPFWVTGHGWRMAKLLKPGDRLHSVNGSVVIDNVSTEVRQKTYNLVVEDFHTYFVGGKRILVHDNKYRRPTTALVPGLARKVIR